jgi:periplasmic protein TonB
MSAYAAHPADSLRRPLAWSLAFHLALAAALVVSTIRSHRGEFWGGAGGGSMSVGLVGSLAGVPLPRPPTVTQSRVVDETRGLHREEPQPETPPPPVAETPIPEFERERPQKIISRPSKVLEDKTEPPPGAIPYGAGGQPQVPYGASQFPMGQGGTTAGMGFEGGGGPGGAFAERYGWYVEAVRRKISNHWLQSTIDPRIQFAPRVVVTFQILRNGSVVNVQMLQSSGNASVDRSALRAILDASPMESLPSGYAGNYVQVEFWFEFRR